VVERNGGVLVLIPTYDEAANLPSVLSRLRATVPTADLLVIDDNSPDGTGELADRFAASDPAIRVLHRPGKQGLGAAYLAGFGQGLAEGYSALVQLDADGSHQPEQLPDLLAALRGADLVIGSRWIAGGSVRNWPRSRQALSRGGNRYVRLAMSLPVRDATAGFRAWRASALRCVDLASVASQGYCFQVDLTRRALQAGCRVVEVPIEFVERTEGESKMSGAIVREALWRVTLWGAADRLARLRSPRAHMARVQS
jgi:glycosyltransferase involved in cell wall biosynthesis